MPSFKIFSSSCLNSSWCDHAIYMGRTKTGKEMYFYGGDFDEVVGTHISEKANN